MPPKFPVRFQLTDGTHVLILATEEESRFEFHLTRLNSEKHNFIWNREKDFIEESYETRFDHLQNEAVENFKKILAS